MAKSVYAADLKSAASACGFESRWGHRFDVLRGALENGRFDVQEFPVAGTLRGVYVVRTFDLCGGFSEEARIDPWQIGVMAAGYPAHPGKSTAQIGNTVRRARDQAGKTELVRSCID